MPMIGRHSGINVSERKDVFEHKEFTGADADTSTNSGFYTYYVNYQTGVDVYVRGVRMANTDYTSSNGTDVRIATSAITLNTEDVVQITGYNAPASQILEKSDVNITGGTISNLDRVKAKMFVNANTFSDNLTVGAGENVFLAGPVNFTGQLSINGVLNIL
tara:strand:+ start:654 stop:1136 length:483 start_codon:yes stop_codon:yes gene_type:complete